MSNQEKKIDKLLEDINMLTSLNIKIFALICDKNDKNKYMDGMLGIDEAARYLGISKHTLYRLKAVKSYKINNSLRFKREDLDDYINSKKQ